MFRGQQRSPRADGSWGSLWAGSLGGGLEGSADAVSAGGKNMQGAPGDWE